jgi:outer membrane protein, adhesin transport system
LQYLDRNTIAIEKARDAYRQQFDIGQRSLLDLLNSENELYTAKRAYANAEYDLQSAYVRTQAAMSQLTASLGLSRAQTVPDDASGWSAQGDLPERCPPSIPESRVTSRSELDQRAQRMTEAAPPVPARTPANTPATLPAAAPPVRK